ncbi:MAG: hypothetical protein SFY32_08760 [Bacteroidota bacterium]|nr:hypothetical protein [Bacteroidota bacterium]
MLRYCDLVFFFSIIVIISCTNDNVEDLKKSKVEKSTTSTLSCDTALVSFSKQIVPIMELQCGSKDQSCHTSSAKQGNCSLDSYNGVLKEANTGKLVSCIIWDGQTIKMPYQKAKLDDCTIKIIKYWVSQGAKNN